MKRETDDEIFRRYLLINGYNADFVMYNVNFANAIKNTFAYSFFELSVRRNDVKTELINSLKFKIK